MGDERDTCGRFGRSFPEREALEPQSQQMSPPSGPKKRLNWSLFGGFHIATLKVSLTFPTMNINGRSSVGKATLISPQPEPGHVPEYLSFCRMN